jgi:uncharacterized damage-inducible protein DinB
MGASAVVESLRDHFTRTFGMLRGAIEAFPEDQWRGGDVEQFVPARQALHIVGTADFYSGQWEGAEFPWDERTGCDWEAAPREALPSQQQLLAYLDDVKARIMAWLTKRGDEGLLGEPQDKRFPWTGTCELARALHLIRHTHHHLGKIHAELRRRGIARPEWR